MLSVNRVWRSIVGQGSKKRIGVVWKVFGLRIVTVDLIGDCMICGFLGN